MKILENKIYLFFFSWQENGTRGNFPQFNLPDSLPESDTRASTEPSELERTSISVKLPMTASGRI